MIYFDAPLHTYINDLASSKSAPGGGSVSALTSLQAISLILMGTQISEKKLTKLSQKSPEEIAAIRALIEESLEIKDLFSTYIDKDITVFRRILQRYKSFSANKDSKEDGIKGIQNSLKDSINFSFEIATRTHEILRIAKQAAFLCHEIILSDIAIAVILAFTGIESAIINTQINIKSYTEVPPNVSHETFPKALPQYIQDIQAAIPILHKKASLLKKETLQEISQKIPLKNIEGSTA